MNVRRWASPPSASKLIGGYQVRLRAYIRPPSSAYVDAGPLGAIRALAPNLSFGLAVRGHLRVLTTPRSCCRRWARGPRWRLPGSPDPACQDVAQDAADRPIARGVATQTGQSDQLHRLAIMPV